MKTYAYSLAAMSALTCLACEPTTAGRPCVDHDQCEPEEYCAPMGECREMGPRSCSSDRHCPPGQVCGANADCEAARTECDWTLGDEWRLEEIAALPDERLQSFRLVAAPDNRMHFCSVSWSGSELAIRENLRIGVIDIRGPKFDAVLDQAEFSEAACLDIAFDSAGHPSWLIAHGGRARLLSASGAYEPQTYTEEDVALRASVKPSGPLKRTVGGQLLLAGDKPRVLLKSSGALSLHTREGDRWEHPWLDGSAPNQLSGDRSTALFVQDSGGLAFVAESRGRIVFFVSSGGAVGVSSLPPFDEALVARGKLLGSWSIHGAPAVAYGQRNRNQLPGAMSLRLAERAQPASWVHHTVLEEYFPPAGRREAQVSVHRASNRLVAFAADSPKSLAPDLSGEITDAGTRLSVAALDGSSWEMATLGRSPAGEPVFSDPTAISVGCGRPAVYFVESDLHGRSSRLLYMEVSR